MTLIQQDQTENTEFEWAGDKEGIDTKHLKKRGYRLIMKKKNDERVTKDEVKRSTQKDKTRVSLHANEVMDMRRNADSHTYEPIRWR